MFYVLPPAGDAIRLRPAATAGLEAVFAPYRPRYYASGTASLAAAVQAALSLRPRPQPEVLLPAYGCPDLVAAVAHTGARPVLVDLAPERPWMCLSELEAAINDRTVAVIAVHLFGIRERLAPLRELTRRQGVLLIEDSAQAMPEHFEFECAGDYVVLSFGRGKPVSLLGGGAVLAADGDLLEALPQPHRPPGGAAALTLKAHLYNLLRRPRCYWLPQALPLGLGETRFQPLKVVGGMDRYRERLLAGNLQAYRARSAAAQQLLAPAVSNLPGLTDLAAACGANGRLLRYPLLFSEPRLRDEALRELSAAGMGCTRMYSAALPQIDGVREWLHRCGRYPNAEAFAARVLTLPTHSCVRAIDVRRAAAILRDVLVGASAPAAAAAPVFREGEL
jgi:dTDP-4-amino-4,6-dideoxygalactose transaminase